MPAPVGRESKASVNALVFVEAVPGTGAWCGTAAVIARSGRGTSPVINCMLTTAVSYTPYAEGRSASRIEARTVDPPMYLVGSNFYLERDYHSVVDGGYDTIPEAKYNSGKDEPYTAFPVDSYSPPDSGTITTMMSKTMNFVAAEHDDIAMRYAGQERGTVMLQQERAMFSYEDEMVVEGNFDNWRTFTNISRTLETSILEETKQAENTNTSLEKEVSITTFSSLAARTLDGEFYAGKLTTKAMASRYNECRNDVVDLENLPKFFAAVTGIQPTNLVAQEWVKEFGGILSPSFTYTALEEVSPDFVMKWQATIPNCYYMDPSKQAPPLGALVCSSSCETASTALTCSINLSERNIGSEKYYDGIIFGKNGPISLDGVVQDGLPPQTVEYDTPPSLTNADIVLYNSSSTITTMTNDYVELGDNLGRISAPWNENEFRNIPSMVNISDLEGTHYRAAYADSVSSVTIEGKTVEASLAQNLNYHCVWHGDSSQSPFGPADFVVGPISSTSGSVSFEIEAPYVVAQAGHFVSEGTIYNDSVNGPAPTVASYLRQTKEVFPSVVVSISSRPMDASYEGLCGVSNGSMKDSLVHDCVPFSFASVETRSDPRILSKVDIDTQFYLDERTAYGIPKMTTIGTSMLKNPTPRISLDVKGANTTGADNSIKAWPAANWGELNLETVDNNMQLMAFNFSKDGLRY